MTLGKYISTLQQIAEEHGDDLQLIYSSDDEELSEAKEDFKNFEKVVIIN